MKRVVGIGILVAVFVLAGCASRFPQPSKQGFVGSDGAESGRELVERSVAAHGGDLRGANDVNVSIRGEWGSLIKKIQPLVTDFRYRIQSEERLLPEEGVYAVRWTGPAGTKTVLWKDEEARVFYNGEESEDADVLESSAMTSDAFQLFHFGPSFLLWHGDAFTRLTDFTYKGREYYRVHVAMRPGFGASEEDEVVAFIDKDTDLLWRVWITLEGFRTTQGATVDVTFLEYGKIGPFTLPRSFVERVRAPIKIHAHEWEVIEWDLDRGYGATDLSGSDWTGTAE